MGQSNIAAGATIGSNHNSRAADGELVAARGFWPGLCVSLKHNSRFASFTLLAKGDYPYELDIQLPFSLVLNDEAKNRLTIMPAYWFKYNMYALARNSYKYVDRDNRTEKIQHIEYDFLAPDSINEIFIALDLLRKFTAKAVLKDDGLSDEILITKGEEILNDNNVNFKSLEIVADGFENNSRPTQLLKVKEAYTTYKQLIVYYAASQIIKFMNANQIASFEALKDALPDRTERSQWHNIGGQLLPAQTVQTLLTNIKANKIDTWDELHNCYSEQGEAYEEQKTVHVYASLLELLNIQSSEFSPEVFTQVLHDALQTKEWMVENIYQSRAKDYENPFRKMIYGSMEEMDNVIGKLEDNVFIEQQKEELEAFRKQIQQFSNQLVQIKSPL
jgi:hypothetical protein